jgi:hypothetical protein
LGEAKQALQLAEFAYIQGFERTHKGERVALGLWRGAAESIGGE